MIAIGTESFKYLDCRHTSRNGRGKLKRSYRGYVYPCTGHTTQQGKEKQTVDIQTKPFQLFYHFCMVWTGPLGSKIQTLWIGKKITREISPNDILDVSVEILIKKVHESVMKV